MIVTLLSSVSASGCGSDKSGEDSGNAGRDTGSSGRGAAGSTDTTGITCGSTTCMPPEGGGLTACCLDPFSSTCGTSKAGGMCGTAQVTGDPRCPAVDIMMGVMLPSCCTDDGKCGIDATMFGMPGCVDLATAAEMAKSMGGASLTFPEPRACADSGK